MCQGRLAKTAEEKGWLKWSPELQAVVHLESKEGASCYTSTHGASMGIYMASTLYKLNFQMSS